MIERVKWMGDRREFIEKVVLKFWGWGVILAVCLFWCYRRLWLTLEVSRGSRIDDVAEFVLLLLVG